MPIRVTKHLPLRGLYIIAATLVVSSTPEAPLYSTGEEGNVSASVIQITFSVDVVATLYDAGVTLKVNGISIGIASADRQTDHRIIHFTLVSEVDANDLVTFEYDDDFGDYESEADAIPLADVSAQITSNYVGTHYWFDNMHDSGHLVHL